MENGLSGRLGNPPHGKDSAFGDGRFYGASGIFFYEKPIGGVAEVENLGHRNRADRYRGKTAAFFTVFFLSGFVRGVVGGGHGGGFDGPRMRFETARAFAYVCIEAYERSGVGERGDRPAANGELGDGDVGVSRIGVGIFEIVHERSGYGHGA